METMSSTKPIDREDGGADAHDSVDESGLLRPPDVIHQCGQCSQGGAEDETDAEDPEDDDEHSECEQVLGGALHPRSRR